MRRSVPMAIASAVLRLQRGPTRSPEQLRREYANRPRPRPAPMPRALRARYDVREDRVHDAPVFTLSPRKGGSAWRVIYTHGGSFLNPLVRPHWHIVREIIDATGSTVIVPIYPLAPEHPHPAAHRMLHAVYAQVADRAGPGRVVLCGDSAGGNLALVQALRCRDLGLPPPGRVVLFAPWLDLTMSNPEAARLETRDVMLRCDELAEAGRLWAGGADPRGPLLSPLFADLRGLPPIEIHQGTDDVFLPDARLLRERVSSAGGRVQLFETEGAFHVFMAATFTPEARATFAQLAHGLSEAYPQG